MVPRPLAPATTPNKLTVDMATQTDSVLWPSDLPQFKEMQNETEPLASQVACYEFAMPDSCLIFQAASNWPSARMLVGDWDMPWSTHPLDFMPFSTLRADAPPFLPPTKAVPNILGVVDVATEPSAPARKEFQELHDALDKDLPLQQSHGSTLLAGRREDSPTLNETYAMIQQTQRNLPHLPDSWRTGFSSSTPEPCELSIATLLGACHSCADIVPQWRLTLRDDLLYCSHCQHHSSLKGCCQSCGARLCDLALECSLCPPCQAVADAASSADGSLIDAEVDMPDGDLPTSYVSHELPHGPYDDDAHFADAADFECMLCEDIFPSDFHTVACSDMYIRHALVYCSSCQESELRFST